MPAILLENDILDAAKIVEIYESAAKKVENIAKQVVNRPRLSSPEHVMESLIPGVSDKPKVPCLTEAERQPFFSHEKHNLSKKQHLAKLINWTLMDLMAQTR